MILGLCTPYVLLIVLSLGSGWSFPNLLPDRIDFAPWKRVLSGRDGLGVAIATSLFISLCVSIPSTALGLIAGRSLKKKKKTIWMFVAYFPFVSSPVVIGTCMYDLQVRFGIASTLLGVMLAQFLFAFAFATVFFSEMWSVRMERAEQLVSTLGGNRWDVWRHAILPQSYRLIVVCLTQTALFSWTDFGLVSVLGGGNVQSLTVMLFSYIREASVNQAAQAGLVLMAPPVLGFFVSGALFMRIDRERLIRS